MADNTTLNTGTGGDVVRDIDRAGIKTQVAQMDIGGASAELLLTAGQHAMASSLPVVIASDQSAVPVTAPTITKSTQGSNGFTTQDLKDAGRVAISITCYHQAGIITTEALFAASAFAITKDGVAGTAGVQFTVTAGKRFRIQSIHVSLFGNAAAATTSKLALRNVAAGGTVANSSPVVAMWDIGSNTATTANYVGPVVLPIPDGLELAGGSSFGFTNLSSAATVLHTITLIGYEY